MLHASKALKRSSLDCLMLCGRLTIQPNDMQWLTSVNPTIGWAKYEVDFRVNNDTITIKRQARGFQLPTVQLCSAKVGLKAIFEGKQAWFVMLHHIGSASLYSVDGVQGNGEVVHDQLKNPALASKWKTLLDEYADVFEQPGKPVAREIDHHIDLVHSKALPPRLRLYRMLENELRAFK